MRVGVLRRRRAQRLQQRIAARLEELRGRLSPVDWQLVLEIEALATERTCLLLAEIARGDDGHPRDGLGAKAEHTRRRG